MQIKRQKEFMVEKGTVKTCSCHAHWARASLGKNKRGGSKAGKEGRKTFLYDQGLLADAGGEKKDDLLSQFERHFTHGG